MLDVRRKSPEQLRATPLARAGHTWSVDPDCIAALTLTLAFGPTTGMRPGSRLSPLLAAERAPRDWLGLDAGALRELGVPPKQRARLLAPETRALAAREARRSANHGLQLLWRGHASWPKVFDAIPDAPFVLWLAGDLTCLDELGVAIVGPRAATPYGLHAARNFARAIALAGLPVVSGLARGVDGAAHRAALEVRGTTIAVLGSGLCEIYPAEHEELAEQIRASGGLLISESPPELGARPMLFPRRNRLLVALSRAVLVVEATRRSGALLSAEWALAYDRSVWAVPGPYASPQSEGCHRLIRDGAYLADAPESLVEDLGLSKHENDASARLRGADQAAVYEAVRRRPQPLDALVSELKLPRPRVLIALRELELSELVRRGAGDLYEQT